MIDRRLLANFDWVLVLSTLLLASVGVFLVASAAQNLSDKYVERQAIFVGLGLLVMLVTMSIDYHRLVDLATLLYLPGIALLTFLLVFGRQVSGAKSWIQFGGFRAQPSELMKIAIALMLTKYLAEFRHERAGQREFAIVAVIAGIPFLLTAAQPDIGTAATYLPIAGTALLLAGMRPRWFVLIGSAFLVFALAGWFFLLKDYQKDRITSFLRPESDPRGAGYHSIQSRIAVGSGGAYGKGYQQGSQSRLEFLPARHTDFIFSVLAEEEGFVGTLGVLGLYTVLILKGYRAARSARDRAGLYLAAGLTSLILFHTIINIGMVAGLLPITGIPLPFLSYGGSFSMVMFMSIGLIANVRMRRTVN